MLNNIIQSLPILFQCVIVPGAVGILFGVIYWYDTRRKRKSHQEVVDLIWKQEGKWGRENCQKVLDRNITLGMTKEMVFVAWGKPVSVDQRKETQRYSQERWVYGQPRRRSGANYVIFRNDVVHETQINILPRPRKPESASAWWLILSLLVFVATLLAGCPLAFADFASRG